jgi:(1->4)-alpha-D-glucan 1-alpha-D-glucosylmutase
MSGGVQDAVAIRATYRLQFHRGFTFEDAAGLVPYLDALGISHLYASPLVQARPGSTHGYDVTDHNRLNPELGGADGFGSLVAALRGRRMGLVLDIVPNHVGIGSDNPWWLDVLEWGRDSPHADWFDINWDAVRPDLRGRVLLPVLGDQYGTVLARGDIELRCDPDEGSLSAWYFEHRFPLAPRSYAVVLETGAKPLSDIAAAFGAIGAGDPSARSQAASLKARLAAIMREPKGSAAILAALRRFNGHPDALHRVLEAQYYRLAYWRVAAEEINYRRFFNINDLAGLRMELPELFEETHRLVFALAREGAVAGLRIDHIDGMFDPQDYCARLRARLGPDFYIVVEKILARYEALPDWPVAGTTGYDFLNQALALFVDPDAEEAMTAAYRRLGGRPESFDDILYAAKKRIMQVNLASEMNVLAHEFHGLAIADRRSRDFTLNAMRAALEEVIAAFPVYRTYVSQRGAGPDDRRYIDWALAQAQKQAAGNDVSIFEFIRGVLTGEAASDHPDPDAVLRIAMHFQQVSGPVMAKGCEDTAFYRYFRLLALNEVGGDPRRFGMSVAAFHHLMRDRARHWPQAMLATATHDTKRGEDARMRLAMLSEVPREWDRRVRLWRRLNRSRRSEVERDIVPDRNVEYLFYQTVFGAWPPDLDPHDAAEVDSLATRIAEYMIKAVREGKERSGWSNPNLAYEAALRRFVAGALATGRPNLFLADIAAFVQRMARPAAITALSQLVLKLTVPGVPDIYQGSELGDFSLVDPDNRRPVDWALRQARLDEVARATPADLLSFWRDGREKTFVTARLLGLRREHPALFAAGSYQPLEAKGDRAGHLCAFARRQGSNVLVTAVPRLVYRLHRGADRADWGGAELELPPAENWREIFTGRALPPRERIAVGELLAEFPVAVLFGEAAM